ncbi:MAG TPA: hypothetical protein VKD90_13675 [Gemmataceae bacterium]|nr:hypothetical protein [Gemmataceae bacterium]
MRIALLVFAFVTLATPLAAREWKEADGKTRFEADLVIVHKDKAIFEKPGGEIVVIPVSRLSPEDQAYLKTVAPAAKPVAPPATAASSNPAPARGVARLDLGGEPTKQVRRFDEMGWGVSSLAFSPQGLVAAGKMDRAVQLFDAVKEAKAATEDKLEHLGQVTCSAFSPAGDVLLTGGYTGQIQVWEVGKGGTLKRLHKYLGHSQQVRAIAFSPDGSRVLSGGEDAALHCWSVKDGRRVAAFDGFDHVMKACHWTADGARALATDGASLFEFDLKTSKEARKVGLLRSWAAGQAAAFSPDGATLVLGDRYDLRIFDTKTGKELAKLADNEIQWTAAVTPDGTRLLTGAAGKVNVWDLKAREKVGSIDLAGTYYVQSLAASPDSRYVAASPASAGQSLQVFRLPEPLK